MNLFKKALSIFRAELPPVFVDPGTTHWPDDFKDTIMDEAYIGYIYSSGNCAFLAYVDEEQVRAC